MDSKILNIAFGILSIASLASCGNDDGDIHAVTPTAEGTVVDDMGNTYGWVRIGNLDWTTTNAKNGPSFTFATYEGNWGPAEVFPSYELETIEDIEANYKPEYGNLMNYADACLSAPDGWRLPTDEDWKQLERTFGMSDADKDGWRGDGIVQYLTSKDGGSRLGLQYGGALLRHQSYGSLVLQYMNFKECGFFWTATPSNNDSEPMAYYRKIMYGVESIERRAATTVAYMSVRWVRDSK